MDFKNTKNKFKKEIRKLSDDKILNKLNDVNLKIMEGRVKVSKKENPYHDGKHPMKLLKWMKSFMVQELHLRRVC